jgi:hypothetical protein
MRLSSCCALVGGIMVGVTSLSLAQTASMPDLQQRFLSLVDDFADKYKSTPNDMAKGALRAQRAKEICALLKKPFKVQDWRGTVVKLSSNNEGKGVLVVELNKSPPRRLGIMHFLI